MKSSKIIYLTQIKIRFNYFIFKFYFFNIYYFYFFNIFKCAHSPSHCSRLEFRVLELQNYSQGMNTFSRISKVYMSVK